MPTTLSERALVPLVYFPARAAEKAFVDFSGRRPVITDPAMARRGLTML
jgi:hypothetical protein